MGFLEVKNLRKSFGKVEVLKGIDFSLEKGEVLAIIGASGGGKTTLLRCLNFLEYADIGTISVNGEIIYEGGVTQCRNEKELRDSRLHFGLVFQSFNLFPQYNVLQNVTLAPTLQQKGTEEQISAHAMETIARVGLTDKLESYPCQLSGGQQQRVAIARALVMDPDILCFDEPTSALDPELTGEVLKVIKGLKDSSSTMIVVTHEMEFARSVADKIIFMADGRIEEVGTPEEIFDHPRSPRTQAFLSKSREKI
ncbi:amino acid ABC transporter ATP-binding protein [Ihubacter sp. rT4E-8]|uniref:amino acid ABC transporter ATP-binding protein n=1 Tax=unclassified Ihubacter TaxID=2633299 RepID=UPI00137B859D